MLAGAAPEALLRFAAGSALALVAGWFAFGRALFDPDALAFHCVVIGALTSGVLALLRTGRLVPALALVAAFALLRLGFAHSLGWAPALAGAALAIGVFVACLIFDLLARYGIPFGKFLVLGPLLGGVYLAVVPLAEFGALAGIETMKTILRYVFVGVLIGDAAGLGVELFDLADWFRGRAAGRLVD